MSKIKLVVFVLLVLIMISACGTPVAAPATPAVSTTESPTEMPPTPYPDTPTPPEINAPVVQTPALVSIHFLNSLDGWGVTDTQIVRTNDGGLTWYNVTPPDLTSTGYSAELIVLDNLNVWLQIPDQANYPNSGTLYQTNDGGFAWTSNSVPFGGGHIQFLDANHGWALADLGAGAGSNAVAIFQTIDGGVTWKPTYINDPNSPNAGDSLPLGGLKSGIAPLNMQTAWVYGVIYSSGTVYLYRTDDGGAHWAQVTSLSLPPGAENMELGIDAGQMKFLSATDGFLVVRMVGDASQAAVYVTQDAGNTWRLTPTLIPDGGRADFLSAQVLVIYNGGQFYVTRDAVQTWSIIPPDVSFGDTFAMMDFVDVSTGWVITADADHHSLYRTVDGGKMWSLVIP